MNSKQNTKLLPRHHKLQQAGQLKHTRPYFSRSFADSNFYQLPKPLIFFAEVWFQFSQDAHLFLILILSNTLSNNSLRFS